MSEHEDQNFDFSGDQLDGDSLDELLRSTREELARLDALMGPGGDEEQPATDEATQMPLFEPELPEEYADLTADTDMADEPEEAPRQRLPAGVKVLLYVCCVLAASVLLAVGAWKCADDVLALTKQDRTVTLPCPRVSRSLRLPAGSRMRG